MKGNVDEVLPQAILHCIDSMNHASVAHLLPLSLHVMKFVCLLVFCLSLLMPEGLKVAPGQFGQWFTWCQSCHHGGHAFHIAEWFRYACACHVMCGSGMHVPVMLHVVQVYMCLSSDVWFRYACACHVACVSGMHLPIM